MQLLLLFLLVKVQLAIPSAYSSPLIMRDYILPGRAGRVATRPGFPAMSRICAMLSRVPARPAPGRQMSRISRCSKNVNNNNNNSYNIM